MTKAIGLYRCKTSSGVKWRVRWFGKYDPNTGKPKRYSKTFKLKKDAERFQKQKQNELDKGTLRDLSNETLKEYAEQWLKYQTLNVPYRPATAQLYRQTLDRLYNYFGAERPLRTIDRKTAKTFLTNLKPIVSGKDNLSNWSKHRVLRHCKTLFSEAVRDGVITNNPFKGLKGWKCIPSDWYYLKADEYFALLDATPSLREKALFALAYTAGLRESEAIALCWSEVDFDKGRIRVVNREGRENLPPFEIKDSDVRTVPVPKRTLDLLLQLQAEAPEKVPYVLATKRRYDIILAKWQQCRETDRPWLNRYMANNVTRNFHRRVSQAGINTDGKELTVHTLRKCCCQTWQNTLPMNVVKYFSGHSSITTTEKYYSTVDEGHFEQAAKAFDDQLNPVKEKAGAGMTDLKLTFSGDSEPNQDAAYRQ